MHRLLIALGVAVTLCASTLTARQTAPAAAPAAPITYRVSFPEPEHHWM